MTSFSLCRRKDPLTEHGEDLSPAGKGLGKCSSLLLCMQLALLCASVAVLGFGLAMTAVGLWAYKTQEEYIVISDNDPQLTRLPFTMMVTGGFVAMLGLLGVVGSIFSRGITGQTLLGVFSFVLVLVIVSEIGAGAAAINLKLKFEAVFINSTMKSQLRYHDNSTAEIWDNFQRRHQCCGAEGYVGNVPPYFRVFLNASVPESCCVQEDADCKIYAENATLYKEHIYQVGCPSTVIGKLTQNLIVISSVSIAIGFTQLFAVALALVVAYVSSRKDADKEKYSYNRLHQEDNVQPAVT